jgi:hypothetical protein
MNFPAFSRNKTFPSVQAALTAAFVTMPLIALGDTIGDSDTSNHIYVRDGLKKSCFPAAAWYNSLILNRRHF